MKRFFRISAFTLGLIIVAFIAILIAVQTPRVQTTLAKRAIALIQDNFGGDIEFSEIQIHPFDALVLKDAAVIDRTPYVYNGIQPVDTILRAKYIVATFSVKGMFNHEGIHIKRAYLTDAVVNLTTEPDGTNLQRFLGQKKKKEKKPMGNIFDASHLEVQNLRFTLTNYSGIQKDLERRKAPTPSNAINWNRLDVRILSLKGKDFKLGKGVASGTILSAELKEKSGYHIHHLEASARVGEGKAALSDVVLSDNWSLAHIPSLVMSYDNGKAFSNFIEKVRLSLEIKPSRIDLRSIAYFAPGLKGKSFIADLSDARVDGYVNDLRFRRLRFTEELSGITGNIKGSIVGLPDSQGMLTDLQSCELGFTTSGLSKFIRGFAPEANVDLSKFGRGESFTFKGKGSGPLNRLDIDGVLSASHGSVYANLDIRNLIDKQRAIVIGSYLEMRELGVGRIAGIDAVGNVSLKTSLSATLNPGSPSVRIDSLVVSKADVLGYPYSGIAAAGVYGDDSFDGRVVCNDPNLNFLFQGIINTKRQSKDAAYKFIANLGYADLNALNIDKRGVSRLSGLVNANYVSIDKGELSGTIDVSDLRFEDGMGKHNVGDISISSFQNDDTYRINLSSVFADGSYTGGKAITNFIQDLKDATVGKELTALFGPVAGTSEYDDYSIRVNFHDTRDILSLLKPGLYIADSTTVRLGMTRQGLVTGRVNSQRVALGNNYLKDLNLSIDNKDGSINGTMRSSEMSVGPLALENNAFVLYADDNRLGVGYSFDNETELENKGELFLTGVLSRNERDSLVIGAQTLPSNIYYDGNAWSIKPAAIGLVGKDISIHNLVASCDEQFISVNGGISPQKSDTLSVAMSKFDLGILNGIMGKDYGVSGFATGTATLSSPTSNGLGIIANIISDKTEFAGQPMGKISLSSALDNDNIHVILGNDLEGEKTLSLVADYNPSKNHLDASVDLNRLNAGYAFPFLNSVFSEIDGFIDGHIRAHGPLNDLTVESTDTQFSGLGLGVDYIKVKYFANGPVHVDSYGLHFDNVLLHDETGGGGTLNGAVRYDHFKNLATDIHLHFDNIKVLGTTEKDNNDFYGNLFATGNLGITGPLNSILIEAEATTTKDGDLHIPMGASGSTKNSDLLVFKQKEHYVEIDPYELMMRRIVTEKKKKTDLGVKLKIEATPNVTAFLEIDKEMGNMLTGNGSGVITIDVNPADGFSLGGDYNISSGNFNFNAMNLAKRSFTIQEGSSVRFNGDVMDTDLDINALYQTKTTLSTLLADTTSVATRRSVECGIAIADKLTNPSVSFSINIPDLDPTTKSQVDAALNTDDKIQKQFIYLLITNNFLPDEQSGIAANNSSSMLYSNVAQMMANQLNNIMEKLDIPLDLGLNYQSDDRGQNIFDVAVSTQLFNNRVIVNGTVGSRQYKTSGRTDEMVGDLDIDVKLDPSGQFRFNMFSHSADDYTNYLDNTQRNGIGLTYQKEFNTIKEALKNMFTSKRRREKRAQRELEDPDHHHEELEQEMITITIERPEEKAEE